MKQSGLLILSLVLMSSSVMGASCKKIKFKPNQIIDIKSAMMLGTRLELPSNLIVKPSTSNESLWDVEGVIGTNQVHIKPNSPLKNGYQSSIILYGDDGQVFDVRATRVSRSHNQPCVILNAGNVMFDSATSNQLRNHSGMIRGANNAQTSQLRQQLGSLTRNMEDNKNKAVINALRKYRYHIYTRYNWNEGSAFVGKNTISDVYDDGRFTYIRLANSNRGILSVETEIGGKNAIAPSKYDDAYGMYRITGIYPKFTLRVDSVKVEVTRRDNASKGAS